MSWYLILCLHIVVLYFLSRYVMEHIFHALHKVSGNVHVSFYILSLLYLPGTVVHECSHFVMSVLLFVPAERITFIPEILKHDSGYSVRFGSVHHIKTDPLRGFLIGIAPLIVGISLLYGVFAFHLLPHPNYWIEALAVYFLFTISSTMFTSKSDLHDAFVIIPILLGVIGCVWIFKLHPGQFFYSESSIQTVKNMNLYMLTGSGISLILASFIYLLRKKLHLHRA